MKKILTAAVILATFPLLGASQATTVPQAANMVSVCNEPCTVTAIVPVAAGTVLPAITLQFGVDGTWNPVFSGPALPLVASDAPFNPLLGSPSDPAYGVGKHLVAQRIDVAYIVVWIDGNTGAAGSTTVPALRPPIVFAVGQTYAVTLAIDQTSTVLGGGWVGLFDLPISGANRGFEGNVINLTINGQPMTCIYVPGAPGGVFNLSCTTPAASTP